MWWKSRKEREEDRQATLVQVLASAMGQAFGHILEAQGKQIEQTARFLDNMQDLSARKAAQIMGSRGGKRTQERKKKAREAATVACPLCENPARKDVTVAMIDHHLAHGQVDTTLALPFPNGAANG